MLLEHQVQCEEMQTARELADLAEAERHDAVAVAAQRLVEAEAAQQLADVSQMRHKEQVKEAAATHTSLYQRLEAVSAEGLEPPALQPGARRPAQRRLG